MTLTSLIKEVKAENKLSSDEIFDILTRSIECGDTEEETFKCVYIKAYGSHLNSSTCTDWVHKAGEKWTLEQIVSFASKMNPDWNYMNKYELWAVMNAWYSDYWKVADKYELKEEAEFYYDMAMAYFKDEDAHGKSVSEYYFSYVA